MWYHGDLVAVMTSKIVGIFKKFETSFDSNFLDILMDR